MNVLLMLAIVAFTGCQAKEPINALLDPIAKVIRPAEDILKMIRETKLGQEVDAGITEISNVAIKYVETLQKQVNPLAEDIMTKITKETEVIRGRLKQDLTTVRDKLEPYAENLKTQLQQKVEDLRVAVAPYADSFDSKSLKTIVLQKTEEFKGSLEAKVKELQAKIAEQSALVQGLAPFAEELKEKLDPYVQNLNEWLTAL